MARIAVQGGQPPIACGDSPRDISGKKKRAAR